MPLFGPFWGFFGGLNPQKHPHILSSPPRNPEEPKISLFTYCHFFHFVLKYDCLISTMNYCKQVLAEERIIPSKWFV
jgi:hypothetical protein